jgi:hypothetical protein
MHENIVDGLRLNAVLGTTVGKKAWKKSKLAVLTIIARGYDTARTMCYLREVANTGRVSLTV